MAVEIFQKKSQKCFNHLEKRTRISAVFLEERI